MEAGARPGDYILISVVPPESLDLVWNTLLPQIKKAYTHGLGDCDSQESLYAQIKGGQAFMIVAHEGSLIQGAIVLSEQHHPQKKALYVELIAGADMDAWMNEGNEALKRIKAERNLDTVEGACRPGFLRKLKGWKTKAIVMELI